MKLFYALALLALVVAATSDRRQKKKNVIIICADDLGFNDVSFRGSDEIKTPNIDALAYNGVLLDRFYMAPVSTPSRSSFMTGKDTFKMGMQHASINNDEPWGLGTKEKIMPQYFKDSGYSTALIGKWLLGFYQPQYCPPNRGFDYYFGHLGILIDYFDHTMNMFDRNYSRGHDLRRNMDVVKSPEYATDLFTSEAVNVIKTHDKKKPLFLLVNHIAPHAGNEDKILRAPEEEIAKFSYIPDIKRRTLAAMISVLDRGVGEVMKALQEANMLEDSVVVFYADNGALTIGPKSTTGSNAPLRGQKNTGWDGAIRCNAIVYTPSLYKPGAIRKQLMHVADLLPTLSRFGGYKYSRSLDGIDQWDVINYGDPQVRDEVVNIDNVLGYSSFIHYPYKLVNGTISKGAFDIWTSTKTNDYQGSAYTYAIDVLNCTVSRAIFSLKKRNVFNVDEIIAMRGRNVVDCSASPVSSCDITAGPCLYNIYDDPCEQNNLAADTSLLRYMQNRFQYLTSNIVPSRRQKPDAASDPINFDLNWQWWQANS